jgi:2-polyprenyl-3-methyl-5-hydroxy-6-metoxy-1,4-benzoquinol methylase
MTTRTKRPRQPKTDLTTCLLCQHKTGKQIRTGIREDPTVPVFRCQRCFLQYIDPNLIGDVRSYYQEEYRQQHDMTPGKKMLPEKRFRMMRDAMEASAHHFQEEIPEGGSVLEVGCSSGYFMDALSKRGYTMYGAEWNIEDATYVRDIGEMPCEDGLLEDIYPGKTFNAVAAIQVLEHQPDPIAFLRQCKLKLIGGGWLYLEVPNAGDALLTVYDIPEYKTFWYRRPHITYWEVETLSAALGALGFEAKVSTRQRYSFANHLHWQMYGTPMKNFKEGTSYLKPVPEKHPVAPILNRLTMMLDKQYRVQLETMKCSDTIVAWARRREI